MAVEEWRDIEGFEGFYQVSNAGRVRSLDHETAGKRWKGRILSLGCSGYQTVKLSKGKERTSKRVHRLVALAFIDNPEGHIEVNHLDGNKKNNRVENLEWCSPNGNKMHAWRTGLTQKPPSQMQFPIIQMINGSEIAIFSSIKEAGELLNISSADICKCCKGRRKTAGGYEWKYKEVSK